MEINTQPVTTMLVGNDFISGNSVNNLLITTDEMEFGVIKSTIGFVKTIRWLKEPFFSMSVIVNGVCYSTNMGKSVTHQDSFIYVDGFVKKVNDLVSPKHD